MFGLPLCSAQHGSTLLEQSWFRDVVREEWKKESCCVPLKHVATMHREPAPNGTRLKGLLF